MHPNLHNLKCTDCGEILAYGLQPFHVKNPRCYLCMCSFTEIAMLFNATQFPDLDYVFEMTHEGTHDAPAVRSKCRKTIDRLKNEL